MANDVANANAVTGSYLDFAGIARLRGEAQRKTETGNREAAQQFEAMFVQMSLKQMRPKMEDGLFNSGLAEDVFYQFLDEAIAKEIARSPNNFGIADSVAKELPNY